MTWNDGVLSVWGTEAPDTIVIREGNGLVGVEGSEVSVPASAVSRIEVDGGGGDDTIRNLTDILMVGRGGAGKNQVAFMVRALLGLTETPTADAADALAIGLTHVRSQETARLGVPGATQI